MRFLKGHQGYDFGIIPMDGLKDDHWGVYICNFEVHHRYEQWQSDNFKQGWPRAYHTAIQRMGVFQFWGKIMG